MKKFIKLKIKYQFQNKTSIKIISYGIFFIIINSILIKIIDWKKYYKSIFIQSIKNIKFNQKIQIKS
jgi:hypothetical protein